MTMILEARQGVEDYIRKNRRNSRLLKNAVGKDKDGPVQWGQIAKNLSEMILESQMIKTFIPLFIVFIWNGVASALPEIIALSIGRVSFLVKNIITIGIWFQLKSEITKKIDDGEMEAVIQVEKQEWTNEGAMETVTEAQSIGEYDKDQLKTFIKQQLMSIAMIMVIHFNWGYTTPLVVGSVMGFLQVKDNPLFRLHYQKEDPTENPALKRPFKTKDFFSEWQKSMAQAQAFQGMGGGQAGGNSTEKKVSAKSLKKAEKQKAAEDKKRH